MFLLWAVTFSLAWIWSARLNQSHRKKMWTARLVHPVNSEDKLVLKDVLTRECVDSIDSRWYPLHYPWRNSAAHWWVRVKSQDMARRRFCYSFDYEEIKRRTCRTVLLKNNSPDFNGVGTCRWLTEYRVTVEKSHNHNSAPCA